MAFCRAVCVFTGLLAFFGSLHAQPLPRDGDTTRVDTSRTLRPDSLTRPDSLPRLDSLARPDSLGRGRPYLDRGAPLGSITPAAEGAGYRLLSKRDLVWQRYFTAPDLLAPLMPAYQLSQGAPGLVRAFSYAGASPKDITALYNGRPLPSPTLTGYDLELYPMEFLERAEIVQGARAALYGTGEALMAINFVQPRFDVDGSYIRLWYAQESNNLTGADILYARNLGERTNLTLGFRRLPTDGEFDNQAISNWSIHGAVMWRPTDDMTLSLTHLFNDARRGLNGGLLPNSPRDPLNEIVYEPTLAEETLRHDVTIAGQWYPGVAVADTTVDLDAVPRFDAALFFSGASRDLMEGDSTIVIGGVEQSLETDLLGVRFGARLPLAFARLEVNGIAGLDLNRTSDPTFQAGGMLELPLARALTVRGVASLGQDVDGFRIRFAGEGVVTLSDSLSLRGTVRYQTLDCQCSYLTQPAIDSLRFFSDARTSLLGEAEVRFQNNGAMIGLTGFFRRAEVPDPGIELKAHTIAGGEARFRLPIEFFMFDTRILGTFLPEGDDRFPNLYAVSDLSAGLKLFNENLDLRVGTTLEYQTALKGSEYHLGTGDFLYPTDPTRGASIQFPNWTVYAHARVGSAYLRVAMRNLLGVELWTVHRYPIWGRSLVLEATWTLID